MKFLRCYIAAFGGLKEKTLEFPAGLCEFCEPNGSGKSTLASFLKAVFYGLSGERKRNLSENERELYTPWEGGNFGGFLEFEAGGKRYRAERFFSPESFLLTDLETGRESLDYGKNLGEELFGLDADSFLGSILMPAKSAGVGATAGLTAKLNDLSGEVFDICAYEGAIRSLEDARKSIALYRGKGGSLYRETERTRMIEENLRNAHAAEEAAAREEEEAGHALHRRQVAEEALNAAEKSLTAQKEAADAVRRGEELKKMLTTLSEREHEKETLLASCPAALLPADGLANLETATVREEQARSAVAEAETRFCILRAARPEGLPGEEDRKKLLKAEEDIEFLQTKLCTLQEEPEPQRPGTRYLFFLLAALFAAGAAAITGIALSPLFFLLFLPAAALLIPLFSALRTNREATQKAKTRAALLEETNRMLLLAQKERSDLQLSLRLPGENIKDALQKADCETARLQAAGNDLARAKDALAAAGETRRKLFEDAGISPDEDPRAAILRVREMRAALTRLDTEIADRRSETDRIRASLPENARPDDESRGALPDDESRGVERPAVTERDILALRTELNRASEDAAAHRTRAEHYAALAENLPLLKQSLQESLEITAELQDRKDTIDKTKEFLTQAKEALETRYLAAVRQGFSRYSAILSDGFLADFNLNTLLEVNYLRAGKARSSLYFSSGWQVMTEICMRLSLSDALYPGDPPPLILDDPFALLDETNLAACLSLLEKLAAERQILYLTAHPSRSFAGRRK